VSGYTNRENAPKGSGAADNPALSSEKEVCLKRQVEDLIKGRRIPAEQKRKGLRAITGEVRTTAVRTNGVISVFGAFKGNNLHRRLDPLLLGQPSVLIRLVVNWDVVALHYQAPKTYQI
jgi:hypothetical protein